MSEDQLDLASEFPAASDDEWRAAVAKALGDRPFAKVMRSQSYDGIPVEALYTKDNARIEPQPDARDGVWQIMAPHWNPDASATNEAILDDLERGATGLTLRLATGHFPGIDVADLPTALEGVYLNMARLELLPGEEFSSASEVAFRLFEGAGVGPADIHASLGVDPVGTLAGTGRLLTSAPEAIITGAGIAQEVRASYDNVTTFLADGSLYHSAGATEAQELGITLATGLAYVRAMEAGDMALEDAFSQVSFTLAADADLFLTIAKFRAFRRLWALIAESCGVTIRKTDLGAVSALRMYTVRDPWVNILRGTASCFAAGVGGADGITVLPHDTMLGLSSPFARRIARNIQIILQEESNLSRVADVSAGSFAIETLTSEVSAMAWKYFQKIEAAGGVLKSLETGVISNDLGAAWSSRLANISKRKDAVTGVSEFPDIHEKPVGPLEPASAFISDVKPAGASLEPLPLHRNAEAFEALRDRGDQFERKTGKKPSIFLANLGPVAAHTARATFAKNFFEAGGIEAMTTTGFSDAAELAGAFGASGATLAVICGRDQDYGKLGCEVALALKQKGCDRVYLAGRQAEAAHLTSAGVDGFIYMGCDVIETLQKAYDILGDVK